MDEAFRLGDRVAVMSGGRLLQYDRPEVLLTRPADPFVSQLTGSADRALKLLSLTTAGETVAAEAPGDDDPTVPANATLRDALAELVWRGATAARVVGDQGQTLGRLTLDVDPGARPARAVSRIGLVLRLGAVRRAARVPARAAGVRTAVRAAERVRRAADLRPGQPAAAGACAHLATVLVGGAGQHRRRRGARHLRDPPGRRRVPAAVAHAGQHRPDVPARGRAGRGRAAGRVRAAADPDRAVRLRPAADLREHDRRAGERAAAGARSRRRHGHEPAGSACGRSSCRWRCR